MELTRSLVTSAAAEYRETAPFATTEDEHAEMLPNALQSGDYGWRDAEWVVQWYYRRHLGAYPDAERRQTEAAFGENDYEAVRDTLDDVTSMTDPGPMVTRLTDLSGVDVPVASGFLHFCFPDRFVPLGAREWRVLHTADVLDDPYPENPDRDAYLEFNDACQRLQADLDVDAQALARALWHLGDDAYFGDDSPLGADSSTSP